MLTWQRAGPANGSPIIDSPGLVVKPNTGLRGLPKIILDVTMAPGADRMAVPTGFLLRDSAYEWEVLTIASGGNQTLSVGHFRTPKGELPEAVTAMNREFTREITRELTRKITRTLALPEWRCACGRQMLKDS